MAIGAHAGSGPTTCINCHDHVNASGTGFTDPSKHVNGVLDGGGDDCSNCHTDANLSASHLKHSSPSTILTGKKLSLGDYGQVWFYSVSYVGGTPKFGCGYCHPNTAVTHMNGTRNLDIDPTDAAAAGTVKAKNGYPAFTQSTGVSVTCSSVYCHSTGYNDGTGYAYQTSPDWFGGSFAGDRCSNCHGNSPNTGGKSGSLSHYNPDAMALGVVGGHFVGIHYNNVYDKINGGLIKDASLRQNAHGTAGTSTTINCNTCHQSTVTTNANDLNNICGACHTNKGSMMIDALSSAHINGQPDVAFEPSIINSKAQIRDNIASVPELGNNWTRTDGYKQSATSKDASVAALNTAVYDSGTKTCSSVACHNGNSAQWGASSVTCNSCHTSLP
jgi:predicted CxxxxCH...CXXCH cytochrome family protein